MLKNNLLDNFISLDRSLESLVLNTNLPIGLATGKVGFCIYFNYLGRYFDSKYKKLANQLLLDVYSQIDSVRSLDPKNGLPSIGLGISYLFNNTYVSGDINLALKDIDDAIFLELSYPNRYKSLSSLNTIYLLFYFIRRYRTQKNGGESEYLLKEVIIHLVNLIHKKIDADFFEEPTNYDVDYHLPLFLYTLNQLYQEEFYNYKIIRVLEELSPKIRSIVPILHTNRIYLLWGLNSLKEAGIKGWNEHINRLQYDLSIKTALTQELRDKNIFFKDGIASLYIILHHIQFMFSETEFLSFRTLIFHRLQNSEVWNRLKDDPDFLFQKKGLYDGYCGAAMFARMNYKNI